MEKEIQETQDKEIQDNEVQNNEVQETNDESKIVEQDDGIFIRQDKEEETQEEPELDPNGQSKEDNLDSDESNEAESGGEEIDEPGKFKGKSREELTKMVEDGTKTITKLSGENKNYREKLKDIDVDPQEVKKKLTSEDFKQGYFDEKKKLADLDPDIDYEEYQKQSGIVDRLQSDWMEARQEQLLNEKINGRDNQVFIEKQKDKFEKEGVELNDNEFDEITELAKGYSNNGLMNEGSFQKALIDKYGFDKVASFYNIKAETKVRKDITKASTNQDKKISVSGTGKSSRTQLVNIDNLSPQERDRVLDSLSIKDLQQLQALREKKGLM